MDAVGAGSSPEQRLNQHAKNSAIVRHSPTTRLARAATGAVSMDTGEALVWADENSQIMAGEYQVKLASGSAALICKDADVIRVCNIYGGGRSIQISVNGRTLTIESGRELMLASGASNIHKAMSGDHIARRKIQIEQLTPMLSVATSDISLISLIQRSEVLNKLLHSTDAKDVVIGRKIAKMAACLMQVTAGRGNYQAR
jgi:hypothetical protein